MKPNIKWEIIKIRVKDENQIIPIDFKLANDIEQCKGIHLSIKELSDTGKNFIPQVGELSLSINAKQEHPLHLSTEYNIDFQSKKESLKLNLEIEPNKNITGFYLDNAKIKNRDNIFLPYTLLIYLECCKSIKQD